MKLERYSVLLRVGDTEKAEAMEKLINDITDVKLKRILTMRYINGWTWVKVGIAYGLDESSVRLYAHRHCKAFGIDL